MARTSVKKVSDLPNANTVNLGDLIYVRATGHHYAKNVGGTLQDLGEVADVATAQQLANQLQQAATDAAQATEVGVPATAGAAGTAGQIAYDATHLYVCVAPSTWVKCTLASW